MNKYNFLVASERSGSNLIVKMLNSHAHICGPSPKHLLKVLGQELFRYGDLNAPHHWELLVDDVHQIITSDFAQWQSEFSRGALINAVESGDLGGLLDYIYTQELKATAKESIFIKELQPYTYLPFLETYFPGSRYIFLVRDPRDMALSWRDNEAHPGGLSQGAKQWQIDQSQGLRQLAPFLHTDRAMIVKYEDLIGDTVNSLTKICHFLGCSYDPEMIDFYKDDLTRQNADLNPAWKNLKQGVIESNFNKFEKELSPNEIAVVEAYTAKMMASFGYEVLTPPAVLSGVTQQQLQHISNTELQNFPPVQTRHVSMVHDQIQNRLQRTPLKRF